MPPAPSSAAQPTAQAWALSWREGVMSVTRQGPKFPRHYPARNRKL